MFEEQMIDKIFNFISDSGYNPFSQIPLLYGKIDFVGVNDLECMVIESKIKNWKSAVKQVISYGYGADYSYIAFPEHTAYYINKKYPEVLKKYSIGLLSVDLINEKKVEILIEPKKKTSSLLFKNNILCEINKRKNESENRVNLLKRGCTTW
jgi:hypothetical protein